ncbi:MAG TPA: ABC transporter permease [Clostridiaceae bacterium]|nr:ABC transporter permease [Clostridiaceae bacterium]
MHKILTVLKYKLKILLSDKSFMLAMTVIPLILTIITGYALKFEKENKIPLAVCDLDKTDYSKTVIDLISKKDGLEIIITDEETAVEMVRDYKVEAAYIIKEGFKENLIKGNTNGIIEQVSSPSSIASNMIGEIIGGEISRIIINITAADWVVSEYNSLKADNRLKSAYSEKDVDVLWQEAWDYTDSLWASGPAMTIDYIEIESSNVTENPDNINVESSMNKPVPGSSMNKSAFGTDSISSAAFGMLTAFIMFMLMFNSSWLVEEKENGTLKRIISGPGAISALFIGNILSLIFIGLIQIVLFSFICTIVFKVNLFAYVSNICIIIIYLFSVISLSLFISSFLKTRIQLQAGAPLFSIITGFIGGCFWNIPQAGGFVKTISLFTPQGLALDLFNIFSAGANLSLVNLLTSWQAVVLILSSILLTVLSYVRIKNLRY